MTAKGELMRLRELGKQIDMTAQLLEGYRAKAEKVTTAIIGTPDGAGANDKISGYDTLIVDTENELKAMQEEYRGIVVAVNDVLMRMSNSDYRNILRYRYFLGLTWESVADSVHYSLRHTTKMHGWALVEYEKNRQKK